MGGNAIGELRNFELNESAAMLDATSVDSSGWEESIPGRKSWTGSAEAFYLDNNTAQNAVRTGLTAGTLLSFVFYAKTGSGLNKWSGSGYIQDFKLNPGENQAVMINISIKGSGALTEGDQS